MHIYRPKDSKVKSMSANGHLISQDGYKSESPIAQLEPLVKAGILSVEKVDMEAMKKAAEKEAKEAEEARARAEKLAKEAKEAEELANKEEAEAEEAKQSVEGASTKKKRDKK